VYYVTIQFCNPVPICGFDVTPGLVDQPLRQDSIVENSPDRAGNLSWITGRDPKGGRSYILEDINIGSDHRSPGRQTEPNGSAGGLSRLLIGEDQQISHLQKQDGLFGLNELSRKKDRRAKPQLSDPLTYRLLELVRDIVPMQGTLADKAYAGIVTLQFLDRGK
jgi:hypothetical protein